jgi:ribosomal protein L9
MLGAAVRSSFNLLKCSSIANQSARGTAIFKRMYPPRLYRKDATGPFRPKLKRREYVYILEENTNDKPAGDIELILATDIEGLGFKGDIVTVSKRLARNHMLPVGVAEYVCQENLEKYAQIRKERESEKRQSLTAHKTMKQLQTMILPIPMSSSVPWTLNKTHVKVAFRMAGVEMTEEQITLPDEPVSEVKEIVLQINVNGLDRVPVRALIYHYSKSVLPVLPPIWSESPTSKFNIYEVISAAAHRMRGLTHKAQNIDSYSESRSAVDELHVVV